MHVLASCEKVAADAVRIRLSSADLADDLVDTLWAKGCVANLESSDTLEADVPGEPAETARLELTLHLRAWQAAHPDVELVIDDESAG